jgi:hypothetical protein
MKLLRSFCRLAAWIYRLKISFSINFLENQYILQEFVENACYIDKISTAEHRICGRPVSRHGRQSLLHKRWNELTNNDQHNVSPAIFYGDEKGNYSPSLVRTANSRHVYYTSNK